MKKLVALGAGAFAGASVAVSIGLFSPVVASSDPGGNNASNVVGVPYAQALQILKSQGMKGYFGGAFGSDVPQSQCIVDQQRVTSGGRMYLNLNCTTKAVKDATASTPAAGGGGGGPNVGSNGVTTVTPTPVGPQPGMNVPGA